MSPRLILFVGWLINSVNRLMRLIGLIILVGIFLIGGTRLVMDYLGLDWGWGGVGLLGCDYIVWCAVAWLLYGSSIVGKLISLTAECFVNVHYGRYLFFLYHLRLTYIVGLNICSLFDRSLLYHVFNYIRLDLISSIVILLCGRTLPILVNRLMITISKTRGRLNMIIDIFQGVKCDFLPNFRRSIRPICLYISIRRDSKTCLGHFYYLGLDVVALANCIGWLGDFLFRMDYCHDFWVGRRR